MPTDEELSLIDRRDGYATRWRNGRTSMKADDVEGHSRRPTWLRGMQDDDCAMRRGWSRWRVGIAAEGGKDDNKELLD